MRISNYADSMAAVLSIGTASSILACLVASAAIGTPTTLVAAATATSCCVHC